MLSKIFEQFRDFLKLSVCDFVLLVEPVSIAGPVRYFGLVVSLPLKINICFPCVTQGTISKWKSPTYSM